MHDFIVWLVVFYSDVGPALLNFLILQLKLSTHGIYFIVAILVLAYRVTKMKEEDEE